MAEEEAELAELRRRAYGPHADLAADSAGLARLAELEEGRRAAMGGAQGDPEPVADGTGGASPDELTDVAARVDPDDAHPASLRARRWFVPAVVATCVAALATIALIAGGVGWSGGYLARWAQGAEPADAEMHLEEVLEQTELWPEAGDSPRPELLVDPDTGEIADGTTYFGELRPGLHIAVSKWMWGRNVASAPDRACLQVVEVKRTDDGGTTASGTGGCGSNRAGVHVDIFVAGGETGYGSGIELPGYAPGTLLRFVYDDVEETIAVWSLPPDQEPDSDA